MTSAQLPGGVTLITVRGEVDVFTSPALEARLADAVDDGAVRVVVDLSPVDFLDSTALGVLVGGWKRMRAADGDLVVVCAAERLLRLFRITRLDEVLPSFPTSPPHAPGGREQRGPVGDPAPASTPRWEGRASRGPGPVHPGSGRILERYRRRPRERWTMRISVDTGSGVPPFEQVRSSIAEQIRSGELPVGTKLPTVRALAADLGIAVNTAAKAYRELEQAGLIETRGRAGTFVSDAGDQAAARAAEAAATYARTTHALGIPADEALAIVRAALGV